MGQVTIHVTRRLFRTHSAWIPEPARTQRVAGTFPGGHSGVDVDHSQARHIASAANQRLTSRSGPLCCTAPRVRFNPGGHRVFDTQSLGHEAWHFA